MGPRGNYKIAKINHKTRPAYRHYHKASRTTGRSAHIFGVYDQSRGHAENVERYIRVSLPSRASTARAGGFSPRKENCTAILHRHSKCRCKTSALLPSSFPLFPPFFISRPVRISLFAFLPIIPLASLATLLLCASMNPSDGTTREFALNHIFHVVSRSNVLNIIRQRTLKDYPKIVGFYIRPCRIYLRLFDNKMHPISNRRAVLFRI